MEADIEAEAGAGVDLAAGVAVLADLVGEVPEAAGPAVVGRQRGCEWFQRKR